MATRCGPLADGLAAVPVADGALAVVVVVDLGADAPVAAGPEVVVMVVEAWPVAGVAGAVPVLVGRVAVGAGAAVWSGVVVVAVVGTAPVPGTAAAGRPAATRRTGGSGRPLSPMAARVTARRAIPAPEKPTAIRRRVGLGAGAVEGQKAKRPRSMTAAGTRRVRTMKVSRRTPMPTPKPIWRTAGMGVIRRAAKVPA